MWTYDETKAGYLAMWNAARIKGGDDTANADRFARKIIGAESRYRAIQSKLGIPWYFVGALHMRESGCDFTTHLHNGDPLTARTKHVPAGRPLAGDPPFTWEASAIDALTMKGLQSVTTWTISMMGLKAELYNGTGYIQKGVNSAYLWAGSTLEQKGKYVADHVWNANFDDPQIGVMTVLKRICELRPDVDAEINGKPAAPVKPKDVVVAGAATTAGATIVQGVKQGWDWHVWLTIGLAVVVIAFIAFAGYRLYARWRAQKAAAAIDVRPALVTPTPILDAAAASLANTAPKTKRRKTARRTSARKTPARRKALKRKVRR